MPTPRCVVRDISSAQRGACPRKGKMNAHATPRCVVRDIFYRGAVTTDNALMAQVSAGELPKLAVLFERHHRALFRYFVSLNRNRELSEDLVQDGFFRMLR